MAESPSSPQVESGQRKFRWFLNLQNFEFEIEAVRSELSRLEEIYSDDTEHGETHSYQRKVLEDCRDLITKIDKAFHRFLPRELFIWQSLFLIQQRILLIVPFSELPAKWATLNKRLQDLSEKEEDGRKDGRYGSKKFIRDIATRLATGAPSSNGEEEESKGEDVGLRSDMIEVKRYLDDKVALELWIAFRLRRYSVMFLVLALVLVAYLVADICILRPECLSQEWLECSDNYSVIAMVVAGSLGALVSALSSGLRGERPGNPPLAHTFLIRPVIGGIAGLFLYLVAQTEVLSVPYPAMYVVAIAFGFSERAFYSVLGSVARSTEGRVAKYLRLG